MRGYEQRGVFRLRHTSSGGIEVWVRGSRIESQVYCLFPLVLALWIVTNTSVVWQQALVAATMIPCALVTLRLARLGLTMDSQGVELVKPGRTYRLHWDQVGGFMGHRTVHDGYIVLVCEDGRRLRVPGDLTGEELNPYGEEGDLSAVDQLNRILDTQRAVPRAGSVRPRRVAPRPRTRAVAARKPEPQQLAPAVIADTLSPTLAGPTHEFVIEDDRTPDPGLPSTREYEHQEAFDAPSPVVEVDAEGWVPPPIPGMPVYHPHASPRIDIPPELLPAELRHPEVPRPPRELAPEPEPDRSVRRERKWRFRRDETPAPLVTIPDPEQASRNADD